MKTRILSYAAGAVLLCSPYWAYAQYNLAVDLSVPIRPVTHCASGSLYGITETIPASIDDLVAPLKPYMFCQPPHGTSANQHPYGDAMKVSDRLKSVPSARVQISLPDQLQGWPYNWPGKDSWLAQVKTIIQEKMASGRDNYHSYNIWNERGGTWKAANGDFYTQCWKPTFDLIRSMDPTAKICGPGDAYYNSTGMSEFLTFCKNNKCIPDYLSWHQWGSAGIPGAVENYRALEKNLGIGPLEICINEYSSTTSDPKEGCPGYAVPFIAKFERHGVESACISWWFTQYPGRLGSLLTPSNQKGGGWYLYKWYGDMSGQMVKITPPNDRTDGIDGFGCIDEAQHFASICVGGNNTGTVNVNVSGIPASFGGQVNVALDYVTWTNKDAAVAGTTSISTKVYNVTNKAISVPVNVASNLYAYRVLITPVKIVGPPAVKFTNPVAGDIFTSPADISLTAAASDADGTVAKVEFFNGTTLLFSDNSAPYSYDWKGVTEGTYTVRAVATDNQGNTNEDLVTVRFNIPQGPYGGAPNLIPGTIQFENYDLGGNGYAYLDSVKGNSGGATFRTDEDVDIETCTDVGEGYNIGYAEAGEWMEYTVSVAATGKYNVKIRAACNGDGRTVSLAMDGKDVASKVAIPNTADWKKWTDVTIKDVQLEAGAHVMRFTIGATDYVNLNYIVFEAVAVPPVVHITSPLSLGTFTANESVTIAATATSENAAIVDVRYYANDVLLGTNNSAPYSFVWKNMAEGSYTVKVEALDNSGQIASDMVTVTIAKAPAVIKLKTGWNLVGCPLDGSTDIAKALASIWPNVETVKSPDSFYSKGYAPIFNQLNALDWGKGYCVKVSADCELNWIVK